MEIICFCLCIYFQLSSTYNLKNSFYFRQFYFLSDNIDYLNLNELYEKINFILTRLLIFKNLQ